MGEGCSAFYGVVTSVRCLFSTSCGLCSQIPRSMKRTYRQKKFMEESTIRERQ